MILLLTGKVLSQKKPFSYLKGFNLKSATTYSPTIAVPSALASGGIACPVNGRCYTIFLTQLAVNLNGIVAFQ